jgi:hypothetical protein
MNDDRILAIQVKQADLQRCATAGGPMSMVRPSSMSIFLMAVRTACQMSASPTPCLRTGAPILPGSADGRHPILSGRLARDL